MTTGVDSSSKFDVSHTVGLLHIDLVSWKGQSGGRKVVAWQKFPATGRFATDQLPAHRVALPSVLGEH